MMRKNWFLLIFCAFLSFSLTACPKKKLVKETKEELPAAQEEVVASDELEIRGKDFVNSKNLGVVYFAYDSSDLSEETRKALASNADYLKKNGDLEILVEGHCDDRGTIGYNLALGQKRASAVCKYYISLGINPKRIGALSYGKEKPVCVESTEECWAKNRRAETKVRALNAAENRDKKKEKTQTEK